MAKPKTKTTTKKTTTKTTKVVAKKPAAAKRADKKVAKKSAAPTAAPKGSPAARDAGVSARLTPAEREKAQRTLMKLATRQKGVSRAELEESAGITVGQARGLIEASQKGGSLRVDGGPKHRRYYASTQTPASTADY